MKHTLFFLIALAVMMTDSVLPIRALALVPASLEDAIVEKANEIKAVEAQIQDTEKQIDVLQGRQNTLSNEISSLNTQVSQVNLGVRLSEINIKKLGLEIDSLQYKIGDTEKSIGDLREGIKKTFQSMQERDGEGFFALFLKNATLADGVLEAQNLLDLNNNLTIEAEGLKLLKATLGSQLQSSARKKSSVEQENENLRNRKSILADLQVGKNQLLADTRSRESAYQAQMRDLQKKRDEIGQAIADLEDQLRAQFDPNAIPTKRPGVLAYPLANIRVTQEYGRTAFAQRAYGSKFHGGIDLAARIGTPVMASDSGTVIAVGNNGRLQYGRYVLVAHDNNLVTLYSHLSRQIVSKGQNVERGQVIGYSGNTGYSTGPHLHFTVYVELNYCRTSWDRNQTSAHCVFFKSFPGAGLVPIGNTINPADYL